MKKKEFFRKRNILFSFKMDKENLDPEYLFYERDKSHNSSFYKQTPGVCTNTREELASILKTTESVNSQEVSSTDADRTTNKPRSTNPKKTTTHKPKENNQQTQTNRS